MSSQLLSVLYFCTVRPTSNVYSPSHILVDVDFYFKVNVWQHIRTIQHHLVYLSPFPPTLYYHYEHVIYTVCILEYFYHQNTYVKRKWIIELHLKSDVLQQVTLRTHYSTAKRGQSYIFHEQYWILDRTSWSTHWPFNLLFIFPTHH